MEEGDEEKPYLDSRQRWTIATGRCLETNPLTGAEWKLLLDRGWINVEISPQGDDYLLDVGIDAAFKQCAARFEFWERLNDARQNALASMAYQLGIDRLCGFHDTIAAVREGRWGDVEALALDSDWAQQTPKRAKRVARQLATGNWIT
jgi:lysozyme